MVERWSHGGSLGGSKGKFSSGSKESFLRGSMGSHGGSKGKFSRGFSSGSNKMGVFADYISSAKFIKKMYSAYIMFLMLVGVESVNIYKECGVSSGALVAPPTDCEEAYESIYNATSPPVQSTTIYYDGCYVRDNKLYKSEVTIETLYTWDYCGASCTALCALTCLPGYYQDQHGQSGCKGCPAGYSQAARGQNSCEACANGQYSLDGSANCVSSDKINEAYSICNVPDVEVVNGGWHGELYTGDCSISNAIVSSIYDTYYCDDAYKQVTGISLASGHTAGDTENVADLGCIYDGDDEEYEELLIANPNDYYGQEFCSFSCLPGYYQDDADGRSCKECPAGYSQAEKDKNHCQPCENGKYSLAGSAKCVSGSDMKKASSEASGCL